MVSPATLLVARLRSRKSKTEVAASWNTRVIRSVERSRTSHSHALLSYNAWSSGIPDRTPWDLRPDPFSRVHFAAADLDNYCSDRPQTGSKPSMIDLINWGDY